MHSFFFFFFYNLKIVIAYEKWFLRLFVTSIRLPLFASIHLSFSLSLFSSPFYLLSGNFQVVNFFQFFFSPTIRFLLLFSIFLIFASFLLTAIMCLCLSIVITTFRVPVFFFFFWDLWCSHTRGVTKTSPWSFFVFLFNFFTVRHGDEKKNAIRRWKLKNLFSAVRFASWEKTWWLMLKKKEKKLY